MDVILSQEGKTFEVFDRFAQFRESEGKSLEQLLKEFKALREHNINALKSRGLTEESFAMNGIHPAFGEVSLGQLLSTWVAHDLGHIGQIARVMAKQ